MREKLIQYVELLFAGTSVYDEVKQEILQNTLDRFDDLVANGKPPEAAYQLAIRGIGDVSEILNDTPASPATLAEKAAAPKEPEEQRKKLIQGLAIALYILCPVPLFIIQNEVGLCLLLVLVAAATGLLIWIGDSKEEKRARRQENELEQSIGKLLGTVTLLIYLAISFWTRAWYISWIIFPLSGAVRGLIRAIMDLKEAVNHEN